MSALINSVKFFNKINQNPAVFLTLVRKAGRKLNFSFRSQSNSIENICSVRISGEQFIGYLRNPPDTNTYISQTNDDNKSKSLTFNRFENSFDILIALISFTCLHILDWNKDFKPGPFPQTEEERRAAAKKYGLLPEDYRTYREDGK